MIAELPRTFLTTDLPAPSGVTRPVAAGGDLQAALTAAQPGDTITLAAGATFRGPVVLPNKTGAGWVTIRTSALPALPPPGVRVRPAAHAGAMPKLVIGAGQGAVIRTAPGAHHVRFIGIEVHPAPGAFVYSLLALGSGNEPGEAALPHSIVVDRCYIHGDPLVGGRRGIGLDGRALAVIDSHVSGFKETGADSQAIAGWNGAGPFKIVNNYLEGAAENVIFGGADPTIPNLVPSDIEIRQNHFAKPLSWRGSAWVVKNLFELKNARRVLVEGNIFEYVWRAAQQGFAIYLTVRNQDGGAPWSTIEDVTFRYNIVRHASAGVNVLAADDPNPSQAMKRVWIGENLFEDINAAAWGGSGRLFQMLGYAAGSTDVVIEHNTAGQTGPFLVADGRPHLGFAFRNNVVMRGDGGLFGTGVGEGLPVLTRYFPGSDFRGNAIIGADPQRYPPNNFFPATLAAAAGLQGTDGQPIGVNKSALAAATAGVLEGAPPVSIPPPTPAGQVPYRGVPFAVPGLIPAQDFDAGGEGISWHDLTLGNQGGFYRPEASVDLIAAFGNATGAVVYQFQTGEWLEYTIEVAPAGTYRLEAHVASEFTTSRWRGEIDGVDVTGPVAVPNTGSWATFQWVGAGGIPLTAGRHVLRIVVEQDYFNLDALRFSLEARPQRPRGRRSTGCPSPSRASSRPRTSTSAGKGSPGTT